MDHHLIKPIDYDSLRMTLAQVMDS